MLGPLLFVIYINDLLEQVRSDIFLFVDDTKIFQQIKGHDDHDILQEDTNIMLSWAEKWQLEFHPDKCVSMVINRETKIKEIYRMHNTEQRQVNQEKDIELQPLTHPSNHSPTHGWMSLDGIQESL